MKQSLGKNEKLKSRKLIEELFSKGKSVKAYPLVAVYMPLPDSDVNLFGVSVSKKRIRNAVDRNLVKRRIREAYRLQKTMLLEAEGDKMALMFIYLKSEVCTYEELEKSTYKLMKALAEVKSAI